MKFKMDYKHRFGFNTQELELTEILDSLGIAYEDRSNCGIAVVEILESDERWSTLKPHLDRTDQLVLTTPIYTQAEMEKEHQNGEESVFFHLIGCMMFCFSMNTQRIFCNRLI